MGEFISGLVLGFLIGAAMVKGFYMTDRDSCEKSLPRDVPCVIRWEADYGTNNIKSS